MGTGFWVARQCNIIFENKKFYDQHFIFMYLLDSPIWLIKISIVPREKLVTQLLVLVQKFFHHFALKIMS